jgi:hypothetical protein
LGKEILSVSNTALELDIISQLKKLQIGWLWKMVWPDLEFQNVLD